MKKFVLKYSFMLLGAVLMFVLNYSWLHNVLIPDPCYYHFHNPNVVMELFYDFGSSSNNHPEPSLINLLVTISFGLIIGYYTFKFLNVR